MIAGSLFLCLNVTTIAPIMLNELNPTADGWRKTMCYYLFANLSFFVIARMITYSYRYINVAIVERETRGVVYLTLMAAQREFIVQIRNWKEIIFHLGQITFGGLFLGFIFYNRPYSGPVFEMLSTSCSTTTNFDIFNAVCLFMQIPADDPIIAISSLSSLTVALCAVSYSISVFGKELTVFKRESCTGSNTGAYYIGKSLAHLPMTLFAPICFLLSFSGLAVLKADWGVHFVIITMTYATFTGVGYTISLITPARVSQLAGIFFVLVCMMFSGGQPTLQQLKTNELLGNALYLPTFVSYTRWVNELVYLTEIKLYTTNYKPMNQLYGYVTEDEIFCWCMVTTFLLFFRIVAYIALVVKE
eukprot:TRINITY_DN15573_c0_g1_i1.p1 TRINITY_DN15573_c0_g1~~TRINITY_DN15573_c0_g1_i1.p1  ORF type:complete len:388 (+),score=22.68 TRINITY_DN15573_c0_g1_i1:86-1165(+)